MLARTKSNPGVTINLRRLTASLTVAKIDFTTFALHVSPMPMTTGAFKLQNYGITCFT